MVWGVFALAFGRFCAFIAAPKLAQALDISGYGDYASIQATLALALIVASASLGGVATKIIAEVSADKYIQSMRARLILFLAIIFGASTAAVFIAFVPYIAENVYGRTDLIEPFRESVICILLISLSGAIDGIQSGFAKFRAKSLSQIIQPLIFLVLVIYYCTSNTTVTVAIRCYSASIFITVVFQLLLIWREVFKNEVGSNLQPQFNWYLNTSSIFNQALPMILNSVLVVATAWIINSMLMSHENGSREMGGYSAAVQARTLVLSIPYLIQQTLSPGLARNFKDNEGVLPYVQYKNIYAYTVAFSVVPGIAIMFFAGNYMSLFGKRFLGYDNLIIIAVLCSFTMAIANGSGTLLAMAGKVKETVQWNVAQCIVTLLLGFVLIERYGATGAFCTVTYASVVQSVGLMTQVNGELCQGGNKVFRFMLWSIHLVVVAVTTFMLIFG